jgi:prevent-host-death family protein
MIEVAVSEARDRLAALLEQAGDDEVYLVKHGRTVGVLVSPERFEYMRDQTEDAEDMKAIIESRASSDWEPFDPSAARAALRAGRAAAERMAA